MPVDVAGHRSPVQVMLFPVEPLPRLLLRLCALHDEFVFLLGSRNHQPDEFPVLRRLQAVPIQKGMHRSGSDFEIALRLECRERDC